MRPAGRCLVLLAVLACLPLLARAGDDVIYPRTTAAAGQPSAGRSGSLNIFTGLLAVACAGGAGWLYWRQRRLGGAAFTRTERKLAIAETRALGNRQHLVVADYEGRKFLLGVCPGRIDLITPLDQGGSPDKS